MNKISFILKKELLCIIRDKKVIISFLLPLVVFPLVNIVLGGQIEAGSDLLQSDLPVALFGSVSIQDKKVFKEDYFQQLKLKEVNVDTEADADELLEAEEIYAILKVGKNEEGYLLNIKYNSYSNVSVALANTISSICQEINMLQYEMIAKQNTTQITKLSAILYDVSPNSQLFLMIPMFITMFLFSGISSVSVDIFAGEKERNTLEVLLVAQIDRRIVLVSKMMAIMIVGFISAIVSVVGYILSIIISSKMFEELHITIGYSIKEYAFFFLNTVLLTLLATMIYSLISITSRSVKEAQSLSSFITLIPGLLSAVLVSSPSNIIDYPSMMLPIYNNIVFFKSILVGTESLLAIIVILLVDLIVAFFLFVICDSMLNNEKYILKYE